MNTIGCNRQGQAGRDGCLARGSSGPVWPTGWLGAVSGLAARLGGPGGQLLCGMQARPGVPQVLGALGKVPSCIKRTPCRQLLHGLIHSAPPFSNRDCLFAVAPHSQEPAAAFHNRLLVRFACSRLINRFLPSDPLAGTIHDSSLSRFCVSYGCIGGRSLACLRLSLNLWLGQQWSWLTR